MSGELQRLLNDVVVARLGFVSARSSPGGGRLPAARQRLVTALDNYTLALEGSFLPVPYKIRDELRLARSCQSCR